MIKAVKTGKYVQCEYCGKTVYKTLSQYNKREHHFCSNKCQSLLKHMQTYEDRPCEECGSLMHVSKKSKQRFCSYACQSNWQRKQVGELNPRYNHVKNICDYCGKEYMMTPYKINASKNHFCSKECRQQWYSNVWSQRDEWREESSARASQLLASNPNTNTKPQIIVNIILDSMNIKYVNEYSIGHYAVDNYLSDYGLFIEVMGDYWHCNREKYEKILYKNQKESIRRDKAKHTYINSMYGVETLYIWESDITNRLDVVKMLIDLYIRNEGKLQNYHSINYRIIGDKLELKDVITVPYQDLSADEVNMHYRTAS